ncbi:hypothetical protein HY229_06715 [Candidatus Acetothermia bacterium]|nr:hypothetical protein [Candidatus Acetothermia bacterium]
MSTKEILSQPLQSEIQHNLDCLRADLEALSNPDSSEHPFAEEYQFEEYQLLSMKRDRTLSELIHAFYRSLNVLGEGHPGLMTADESTLEMSYRTIIESAIQFGEQILKGPP